jgi:hypothetical protein
MAGLPAPAELHAAVVDAIGRVAGWDTERRIKEADGYADLIASGADVLWADETAARRAEIKPDQVRAAIVTGLAILAHRSGGVTFAGLHFDAVQLAEQTLPSAEGWALLIGGDRQAHGAFFTPRALAEEIVDNALGVICQPVWPGRRPADIASKAVADIACGSGAFLVAAARSMSSRLATSWEDVRLAVERDEQLAAYDTDDPAVAARALVIEECLYGVDVNPMSVELTGLALQLLMPTVRPFGGRLRHLRVGDALIGRSHPDYDTVTTFPDTPCRFDWLTEFPAVFGNPLSESCGFDAVVGNPPFLGGQKLTGTLGVPYREHLIKAIGNGRRGSADLAAYFWLRAHELVSEVGVVGIVATNTLLQGATARVGQYRIERTWPLYRRVLSTPWPSKSAAVHICKVWTHHRVYVPEQFRSIDDGRSERAS